MSGFVILRLEVVVEVVVVVVVEVSRRLRISGVVILRREALGSG
jgi:hypothetical protein